MHNIEISICTKKVNTSVFSLISIENMMWKRERSVFCRERSVKGALALPCICVCVCTQQISTPESSNK